MRGGNYNDDGSSDRGLLSRLAGYAVGQYLPSYGAYPPQGYLPRGYPLRSTRQLDILLLVDTHQLDILSKVGTHRQVILVRQYILPEVDIHQQFILVHQLRLIQGSGPSLGALIAGGAAAAAAAYGAHQLSQGAHNLTHGGFYGRQGKFKRGKHGRFGKRGGKFRKWK
ncbi:unnamed protein product [Camellia sinensis]